MTESSAVFKIQYSGDGSTTTFSTGFNFVLDADVTVILATAAGVETTWIKGTEYTLTGANTGSNGTVTSTSGNTVASGSTLTIKRDPAQTQETALPLGGPTPSANIEAALDRNVHMMQALLEQLQRSLKLAETAEVTDLTFPTLVGNTGKTLVVNADEDGFDLSTPTDGGSITIPLPIGDGGSSSTTAKAARLAYDFTKGADVASATALALGADGNYFDITGTTGITSIGTWNIGDIAHLHFDGILLLTHSSNLVLPGGANITTVAGDEATFVEESAGVWRMLSYQPYGPPFRPVQGTDIASASPLVILLDGSYFDVTGTSSFSAMTVAAGTLFMLQFDGALTITDGATLDLGGANITTHAGTRMLFFATAANTVVLIAHFFEGDQRRVDSTGAVTNAVQPAFRAYNDLVSNVTGDSTDYTVVFANEVFDQNADFDGTSTFTAPITGKYLLTANIVVSGMVASDNNTCAITTSNDTYIAQLQETDMPVTAYTFTLSIVADMDAADTAIVVLDDIGETKIHDLAAGSSHFSGCLLT